jgi:LPS-assembly protein
VFGSADQSATEIGKESTLKGNVDIPQGNKTLHSTLATLNQETGAYSLESGVTFRQTGMMISAARAQGNMNEEEVRLYDTKYVVHDKNIRGDAAVLIRRTKEVLDIEEGSYTFCPPGNESWKISASNINLDIAAGFGRADDARLKLFNNTVLYLPVFYFPIDDRRKSGFLYPSFKFSSNESSITLPYYFNIAPQMDDTLTTTLFSDSNILLENELRYLDKNSRNRFSNAMASKEDSNSGKRWLLGLNHEGKYDKITTNINYVKVSDDDYFSDFGSNLNTDEGENDHLDQSAKVTYQADTWQSSVLVQQYQTIDNTKTTPYRRLPEIRFSGSPDDNFDNFDISYRSVLTRFDRDLDGLSAAERTTGDRLIINPSITGEFRSIWGYARPAAKLWHASYNLNNQADNINSKQNVTVPILEVDSGLLFDRDFSFQDTDYIQTLEPRLYGLYVPYRDQTSLPDFDTSELTFTYDSLFRDNRFSGDDRFGDAKQISLGLTSRVISEQGREIISASVGHAFYFDDRKVRIDPNDSSLEENTSDFATALTWRPNKRVRALFDASFGASTFKNSEMTIDLKYEEDPDHVIGLRHRFTRGTRKQTTLSYLWSINPNWSSLGLVQYNWLSSQTVDLAAGLEYQTCCWKTRIVIRDELESNNKKETSIALQFVLTGLGGIGKSPTKELQDKIKGYQKREYYNANN